MATRSARDVVVLDGQASFTVTWFDRRIEELIDFDPATFGLVNREGAKRQGIEVAVAVQPNTLPVELSAHYTHVDNRLRGTNAQVRDRPRLRGGAALGWRVWDGLRIGVEWLWVGRTVAFSVPTGTTRLGRYHRVDLSVLWQVNDALRIRAGIDNLTDATYREAPGFLAPGIRPRLSARVVF